MVYQCWETLKNFPRGQLYQMPVICDAQDRVKLCEFNVPRQKTSLLATRRQPRPPQRRISYSCVNVAL